MFVYTVAVAYERALVYVRVRAGALAFLCIVLVFGDVCGWAIGWV